MKKPIKKCFAILLVITLTLTAAPLSGFVGLGEKSFHVANAVTESYSYQTGDIIEFGSYPQDEVTDEATISALNVLNKEWYAFGYYSGNGEIGSAEQGNLMQYCDVYYNNNKYRGVCISQYRPNNTFLPSSPAYSEQDNNGYSLNTVYWFEFSSLKWRILDPSQGLILSESVIDVQAYSNLIYDKITNNIETFYNDKQFQNYANDYKTSSIREWLNNDFYNTAFNESEQNQISVSTLDNNSWDGVTYLSTDDKIFLPSWAEMTNTDYGFLEDSHSQDENRCAKGTDYAKIQGLICLSSNNNEENTFWRLRTPGWKANLSCYIGSDGVLSDYSCNVHFVEFGIRPALRLNSFNGTNVKSEGYFQIYSNNATNSVPVGEQMTFWLREYYNASIVNDLDSCVISFAPEGIYQVTGTSVQNLGENNDVYYGVTVQAETAGSTLMTISDPNTGVYISVALTATDAMNVWRFNTVPVDTKYEEDVNTNFYNYNRLCIANFDYELVNEQPSEGEAKYQIAMDAYNANFHYAAVVAYDKNGEIYDTALIAPHKENETTLIENAGELLYLIGDTYHLIQNEYYYTGWSISTYTRAEVDVPEDGYIVITNNSSNPVVYTANLVDIAINFAFTSAKVVSGMVSSTNTSDAVSSIIREILVKAAEEGGWGFIEAFVQNALKTLITTETVHILLENFSNYLNEVDIDFSVIVADTLNAKFFLTLPETILYNVIPFGRVISLLFSSLDVANFTSEVIAYCNSFEAPMIVIYHPLNDDKAYVTNGVNVIPENGVEEGYVAHSFIVGEDDTIILNAQTALDAISKNRVVYDVTLYQGGTATQPDGKIKVMLPIPEEFDRDRLTVYWVKENGELQSMHCYLEGEYICFETDHLSYYAILELNADSPSDIEPATSETDSPVTDPSTEPSTEPPVTEPSEPEYVLGDVNGDGRITSADARLALRAAVSLETLDAVQLLSADANGDGKVTSADARLILRVAVGLDAFEKKE